MNRRNFAMNKMSTTAINHTDILYEAFCQYKENEKNRFLVDNLIIDKEHKKICLAKEQDNGVVLCNDTVQCEKHRFYGKSFYVFHLFKRNALKGEPEEMYENPFVCALKNKNDEPHLWHFEISDDDVHRYILYFLETCKSIAKEYDTIIKIPTSHNINERFMDVIFKQVKANNKVEDLFYSTTKVDAYNSRNLEAIWKYSLRKCDNDSVMASQLRDDMLNKIELCFDYMKGKYFKASQMDKEYIKFIRRIVTPNNKYTLEKASKLIRGKRVLVLDDTLSTDATISLCVKNIQRYGPGKLHVINLFGNRFN